MANNGSLDTEIEASSFENLVEDFIPDGDGILSVLEEKGDLSLETVAIKLETPNLNSGNMPDLEDRVNKKLKRRFRQVGTILAKDALENTLYWVKINPRILPEIVLKGRSEGEISRIYASLNKIENGQGITMREVKRLVRGFGEENISYETRRMPLFKKRRGEYRARKTEKPGGERSHIRNYRPEIPGGHAGLTVTGSTITEPYPSIFGHYFSGSTEPFSISRDPGVIHAMLEYDDGLLDQPRYARNFSDEAPQSRPKIPWRDLGPRFRKHTPHKNRKYMGSGAVNSEPPALEFKPGIRYGRDGMPRSGPNPFGVRNYRR